MPFSGGNSKYCLGEEARTRLINDDNWTITDGGLDCTTATNDYSFSELKIFPIPVKDILNISNDTTINKVIIYSILGNKIKEVQPNLNKVSLNINNLPAGKYYLRIYSKDKTSSKLFFKE